MIGTIITKPVVDKAAFRAAMRWTCDPRNNARMYEYHDRYEVGAAPTGMALEDDGGAFGDDEI